MRNLTANEVRRVAGGLLRSNVFEPDGQTYLPWDLTHEAWPSRTVSPYPIALPLRCAEPDGDIVR